MKCFKYLSTALIIIEMIALQVVLAQIKIIGVQQFDGIIFEKQVAKTFIQDEVFVFNGSIVSPIFLNKNIYYVASQGNTQDKKYTQFYIQIHFIQKGKQKSTFYCDDFYPWPDTQPLKFYMGCQMLVPGDFTIVFQLYPVNNYFYDRSQEVAIKSATIRTVLDSSKLSVPKINAPENMKPSGLSIFCIDNTLKLNWTSKAAISNITFYQFSDNSNSTKKMIKKQLLTSMHSQILTPGLFNFRNFSQGKVFVELSHADSSDGTLHKINSSFSSVTIKIQFQAFQHVVFPLGYFKNDPPFPYTLNVSQKYISNVTFDVRVKNYYYLFAVGRHNLQRKYLLNNNFNEDQYIKQNYPIILPFTMNQPGPYFIQSFSVERKRVINHAIYVGGYPFIPHYFDFYLYSYTRSKEQQKRLREQFIGKQLIKNGEIKQPTHNSTLQQKRQYILQLINSQRKLYNVSALKIDANLSLMAQNHSQNMKKLNFYDMKQFSKQIRRIGLEKFNIVTLIRGLIMKSQTLSEAYMANQIHTAKTEIRTNRLLTSIGIGIVTNNTEYLITVLLTYRDFTKDYPTISQIKKYEQDLISIIMNKNPSIVKQNKDLSNDIVQWSKQQKVLEKALTEFSLEDYLYDKHKKIFKAWTKAIYFSNEELIYLSKDDDFFNFMAGTQVGLAIAVNNESLSSLSVFAVFI